MKRSLTRRRETDAFQIVRAVGLTLPGVVAATRYDGSPVLKLHGCFMAGLATDYYEKYPLVLVRLACVDRDALHDLLSVSWRLTAAKAGGLWP